jgi:predicted anti-sigma-YlaC factor YlaD
MTCPEFDDRLFDEDCRSALLGRADVPRDVAEHLGLCATCAQEWSRAAAEAARLSRLLVAPPPALRGRLLRAFRAGGRRPARRVGIDVETVCSAIALGALGAGLAGSLPGFSEWEGFVVGASLGLAAEAVRRSTPTWRGPGPALARVLRRCLASLVPVA